MGMDPGTLSAIATGVGSLAPALQRPPSFTSTTSGARSDAYQAGALQNPTITLGGDFNLLGGGARGASAQTAGGVFQAGQPVFEPNPKGFNISNGLNLQQIAIIAGLGLIALVLIKKRKG